MELFSEQLWENVAGSELALAIRESIWIYPFLETLHVVGLALLFGAIATFDLRVLGFNRELSVSRLWHHVKPLVWIGFLMAFVSGTLMFVGGASDFAANLAVQIKLALIVLAGINAGLFEYRLRPAVAAWDRTVHAPRAARVAAGISLTLWLLIMIAGRLIAYIK
jgi:hypothetical protein